MPEIESLNIHNSIPEISFEHQLLGAGEFRCVHRELVNTEPQLLLVIQP